MKKILSLLMLSAAIGASAQLPLSLTKTIGNNRKSGLFVVPSSFTYGDHAYFSMERSVSPTDSEPSVGATGTFGLEYDIYDENLEKVKTIPIYNYTAEYKAGESHKERISESPSWTEAKEWMKNALNVTSFDEDAHRGNTEEGDKHYFIWEAMDNGIYDVFTEYEWVPVGTIGSAPKVNNLDYYDFDDNAYDPDRGTYFTQTLFNDDELFEYIVSDYGSGTFTIMQEGGKVLQTITTNNKDKDPSIDIVKLKNKIYLVEGGSYQDMNFYYVKKGSSANSAVKGDLTGDGEVNAADAVKLVDIIMGK